MHPNPIYRQTETDEALGLVRARAFGLLVVSAEGAPLMAHVPFLLSADGMEAQLHLVRSNPLARACRTPQAAKLAVSGPDGYVSPDWYGLEDQVPTWNYLAVHLTGTLHPMPQETLELLLAAQSAAFEARLPKTPWTMEKMSPDTKARFLRMIQPFRLLIEDVQSTFKLNQNKPDAAREAAAREVEAGFGSDLDALALWMRRPPEAG